MGTYNLNFTFPGQAYAQYSGGYSPTSVVVNDTYLPSTASTKLLVQQEPIPAATTGFPATNRLLDTAYISQNSNWYVISSDWLGTGNPQFWAENYFHNVYVPDAIGSNLSRNVD